MVFKSLRGHVQRATGLMETTTSKARAIVRDPLTYEETGRPQMSDHVGEPAGELVATGRADRTEHKKIVKVEAGRLSDARGPVRSGDADRPRCRAAEPEAGLAAAEATTGAMSDTGSEATSGAGSDTVGESMGDAARVPRARGTIETVKSTSGGGV